MEIKRYSLSGTDKPPEAIPDSGPLPYVPFNSGTATENSTSAPGVVAIDTKPVRASPGGMHGEAMNGTNAAGTLTDIGPAIPRSGRLTADTLYGPEGIAWRHDMRMVAGDPDYYFRGAISEELLHKYLDRSLAMVGFCKPHTNGPTPAERVEDLKMIRDLKPKFIGRMAWFWGSATDAALEAMCSQLRTDINFLHDPVYGDPDIICQGGIFETIDIGWTVERTSEVTLPSSVLAEFGISSPSRFFKYGRMLYDDRSLPRPDIWATTPDITKVETQMWFYYLATRYIDCGCEAIHFGDMFLMAKRDVGHRHLWNLVIRVRRYAASRNRGVVLCDAHTVDGYYYDPRPMHVDNWQRQLVFDFHSLGVFFNRKPFPPCSPTYQPLMIEAGSSSGLLNHSFGGLNPQGWICIHNPTLLEYDNGYVEPVVGCAAGAPALPSNGLYYGWDHITWFALQNEPNRNKILKYTYYKIKCLDPYSHFQMQGRRYITPNNRTWGVYRANAFIPGSSSGGFNQQQTIKDIWNGLFSGPYGWLHNNFTVENVANGVPNAISSLLHVGDDKKYYIAGDGYIHGYIKVNGEYNGGTWLTVSPSYAAGIPVTAQVKAKSDLVANPEGTRLLYIGVDGFIYGFDIINAWVYSYINYKSPATSLFSIILGGGFMGNHLLAQGIRAVSSLTYTRYGIFYIGQWLGDGSKHIHGFQYHAGEWYTVSPSYSAVSVNPIHITRQQQASGSLAFDDGHSQKRIFYKGVDGLLYYFIMRDIWTYEYFECSRNYQLRALKYKIQGNLCVHYYAATNTTFVYFIYTDGHNLVAGCVKQMIGSEWILISQFWDGIDSYFSHIPSDPAGIVAVSPDGNTIAYFGSRLSSKIIYFKYIDGVRFSYHLMESTIFNRGLNSLHFFNNNRLFYVSSSDGNVHNFSFGEMYCNNSTIAELP